MVLPTKPLASHALLGSMRDHFDPFTVRWIGTLLGKLGYHMAHSRGAGVERFDVYRIGPDADTARAREDAAGEAYETEHHELSPLDRQRLAHEDVDARYCECCHQFGLNCECDDEGEDA